MVSLIKEFVHIIIMSRYLKKDLKKDPTFLFSTIIQENNKFDFHLTLGKNDWLFKEVRSIC